MTLQVLMNVITVCGGVDCTLQDSRRSRVERDSYLDTDDVCNCNCKAADCRPQRNPMLPQTCSHVCPRVSSVLSLSLAS